MTGRRWSDGLHQAVEAKEGVPIQSENQTLASITFQNYFRMYGKLSGMTGTADTEAYEFQEIYGLETVVIPPNLPTIRKDELDLVYKTSAREVRGGDRGHPRLPHARPAGARRHDLDRELRAALGPAAEGQAPARGAQRQAARQGGRDRRPGRPPGRDHDRHQHGRPRHRHRPRRQRREPGQDHRRRRRRSPPRTRRRARRSCSDEWQGLHDAVKAQGGLRIIATERHESRRIDNQLRGRSGRQGDPGSSRFYLIARRFADAHLRRRPRARDHGAAEDARRRGDRGRHRHPLDRGRAAQGRGAQLRHPQAAARVRRRRQRPAQGDLPAAQRHPRGAEPDGADRQPAQEHDGRRRAHLRAGRERRGAVGPEAASRRCWARSGRSTSS